jgi:tetratricopeptide (TPR) repeat protein
MEELRGRSQKAEDVYRKALQVDPAYGPAANNLAYLMLENGESVIQALSLAWIARQKMPDSASAADTLAWAYYQYGSYDAAADLLQEALQKAPDNATYHYHIGMVYQKQKNTTSGEKTAATHFTTQSKRSRSGQDSQNLEPNELLSDNSPEPL